MRCMRVPIIYFLFFTIPLFSGAQRVYRPHSELSAGNWYKLGVVSPGVYKIDIPFLRSIGMGTTNLSSASVRILGNGGEMLPEANNISRPDDLQENSILVVDGGDGIINGSDYILFYANGPHRWVPDSVNRRFVHQKNIYTDTAYYFISAGGSQPGKRIASVVNSSSPAVTVSDYDARFFHERDTINFLSSGKEWYGEEFADAPGKTLTRNFSVPLHLVSGRPVTIITECVARSVNAASGFNIQANNQPVLQVNIPATGAGAFDLFAREARGEVSLIPAGANLVLGFTYQPGSFNAQGWLNWFEVHGRSPLAFSANDQLLFRDWNSVGNNTAEFVISNAAAGLQVWDVTDPLNPLNVLGTFSGNEFRFRADASRLREYVAFAGSFKIPQSAKKVNNQDLHHSGVTDYIIITDKTLQTEAERLARFHRQNSALRTQVFLIDEIYNEFSSGSPDATAIRDFVKMYYDKALMNGSTPPRYLALFGDASYDYKNRIQHNTNIIPCYQNRFSTDPLSTYTSDDFFGFLDDHEDINSGLVTNLLDIGIGRIPARNATEAKNYVDKVIAYHDPASFGSWRNHLTFIADDEDNNLHLNDAEIANATVAATNPLFITQKVYLDAFSQQTNPSGTVYPGVIDALNNRMLNGTLIYNYSGHGSARRLAEETVLDQSIVNSWNNGSRLPLFITATCDFAPYDNPFSSSLGENILLRPNTGGIAMMTTTRLVFAFSNRVMNNNYLRTALAPDSSGKYLSLGEAVKTAKNFTYLNSADVSNNRKFTLLGDPALTLGFPDFDIRVISVNNIAATQPDTLSAMEKVFLEAHITDRNGNTITSFEGNASVTLFDKPRPITTLGNDPSSPVTTFSTQTNILFKGKASVRNGKFGIEFKLPRDIDYPFGNGKMSFYAENGTNEAGGFFTNFIIGGNSNIQDTDKEGPDIKAWLNDEKFVNGGITGNRPVLILRLSDSSGINTSTAGIGHDITVTIDNDQSRVFILNDFYEADQDNYRSGKLRFQLPELPDGEHRLHIKAWDALNNSAEAFLDFSIVNDEELVISRVLNYPNPFTTKTQFWFEHNKAGQELEVRVRIFTLSGRIIKTLKKAINTEGNRSNEVEWDGRDEFGDKVGRGVYLYELSVSAPGTRSKSTLQKLVVF